MDRRTSFGAAEATQIEVTVNGRRYREPVDGARLLLSDFLRHTLTSRARTWAASTASVAPAP